MLLIERFVENTLSISFSTVIYQICLQLHSDLYEDLDSLSNCVLLPYQVSSKLEARIFRFKNTEIFVTPPPSLTKATAKITGFSSTLSVNRVTKFCQYWVKIRLESQFIEFYTIIPSIHMYLPTYIYNCDIGIWSSEGHETSQLFVRSGRTSFQRKSNPASQWKILIWW